MTWRPDPSFYPSPRMAMKAPAEKFAYVAAFDPTRQKPDAIAVVDVDPGSKTYANILGSVEMPSLGDELHHFGWNACSSCLCPNAPHPHVERRYLVVPGLRSSRIHILDTKPDPRPPYLLCAAGSTGQSCHFHQVPNALAAKTTESTKAISRARPLDRRQKL